MNILCCYALVASLRVATTGMASQPVDQKKELSAEKAQWTYVQKTLMQEV